MNPTSIAYTTEQTSLVQALVNVLSVVGGIFMVFKVVDSYVWALSSPATPAQRYERVEEKAATELHLDAAGEAVPHRLEASAEAAI